MAILGEAALAGVFGPTFDWSLSRSLRPAGARIGQPFTIGFFDYVRKTCITSDIKFDQDLDMERTVTKRILQRIRSKERGWTFTPKEFAAVGPRTAVDQALRRLSNPQTGIIRKVARGVYLYPEIHPRIGPLSRSAESVAKAIASKTNSRLLISPGTAANLLGLSTQVPARNIFLTEGPSRTVKIGNQTIVLKHVAPSKMVGAGTEAEI